LRKTAKDSVLKNDISCAETNDFAEIIQLKLHQITARTAKDVNGSVLTPMQWAVAMRERKMPGALVQLRPLID